MPASEILDFAELYRTNCSACHGADGMLGPAPPLNDPLFLAIVPDEQLLQVVTAGRAGTPMPAFSRLHGGPLSDAQVRAVADGIKSRWLSARPPSDAASHAALPSYAAPKSAGGAASAELLELGRQCFARACAECHGRHGGGGDMAGAINVPAFLALVSDQELRRLIITGRPDLGMPTYFEKGGRTDDFEPLTSEEIDALVGLLASWRDTTFARRPSPATQLQSKAGWAAPRDDRKLLAALKRPARTPLRWNLPSTFAMPLWMRRCPPGGRYFAGLPLRWAPWPPQRPECRLWATCWASAGSRCSGCRWAP